MFENKEVKSQKRPMFYYSMVKRGDNTIPVITVASEFNPEDNTVNRGIAICSTGDNPSKAEGRKLALKRLAIAKKRQANCQDINWTTENILASGAANSEFTHWNYKVQYHMPMEDIEKRVFLRIKTK